MHTHKFNDGYGVSPAGAGKAVGWWDRNSIIHTLFTMTKALRAYWLAFIFHLSVQLLPLSSFLLYGPEASLAFLSL